MCLNGKVDTHKLEINTSSICEAEKLNTKKTILISKAGALLTLIQKHHWKQKFMEVLSGSLEIQRKKY